MPDVIVRVVGRDAAAVDALTRKFRLLGIPMTVEFGPGQFPGRPTHETIVRFQMPADLAEVPRPVLVKDATAYGFKRVIVEAAMRRAQAGLGAAGSPDA